MLSDPAMSSEALYGFYMDIRYAEIHRDVYIYIYMYIWDSGRPVLCFFLVAG